MPYTPPYPGGWEDFPNTTTPITAAALDTMDAGIDTAQDTADAAQTAAQPDNSDAIIASRVFA